MSRKGHFKTGANAPRFQSDFWLEGSIPVLKLIFKGTPNSPRPLKRRLGNCSIFKTSYKGRKLLKPEKRWSLGILAVNLTYFSNLAVWNAISRSPDLPLRKGRRAA